MKLRLILLVLALTIPLLAASAKLSNVVLYQPDAELKARLGGVNLLAGYIKQVKALCEPSFNSERPEALDIVIIVKPGGKARVWFVSTLQKAPDRTKLKQAIEAIPTPPVKEGPVAFALSYDLNGAERKKPSTGTFQPPIPEEWKVKAKETNSYLRIPDGVIPLIWPDK